MPATTMSDDQRSTAYIFNSAVAAWAISAAWEVGALDELRAHGTLDAAEFARRNVLDLPATVGMFRALAAVDIVKRVDTHVAPSTNFPEVWRNRAFFHWLARGSAELFRQMPTILKVANRQGAFYQRDPVAIAHACQEINRLCYDEVFWMVLESLDLDLRSVADLGSGSGERILEIVRRYPEASGIGIDISESCVAEAARTTTEAGLESRATFVADDVLRLAERPEFADVNLLTCFMMGHDLWPRQQCVETLRRLHGVFPNVRRFLLGDATRTTGIADEDLPTFTLAFELGHDLMGSRLPTIQDWEVVFPNSGWRVVKKHVIDLAVGEVIFDLEPMGH